MPDKKIRIMNAKFAESVYTYFQNKMKETGEPLNEVESQLFKDAERFRHCHPISCLTMDDIVKLGYGTSPEDEKKLPFLAEKLGESYHEELYWDNLDNLAFRYGFNRNNGYELMVEDYKTRLANDCEITSVSLIIQYKNQPLPTTAIVAIGENVTANAGQIMSVKNPEELKPYFDKNNRYGFYIKEHIDFM